MGASENRVKSQKMAAGIDVFASVFRTSKDGIQIVKKTILPFIIISVPIITITIWFLLILSE